MLYASKVCCVDLRLRGSKSTRKNIKGIAMLEVLPIILIMFVLMGATLGSWGLVHTAILNSIAARHYSFFYFNNRSNLSWLRDMGVETGSYQFSSSDNRFYGSQGSRFAFITSENHSLGDKPAKASLRFADFKLPGASCEGDPNCLRPAGHNAIHGAIQANRRNKKITTPAWIMVGYGICLTAACH